MKVTIDLTKSEIRKLEELTDVELFDDNYISDDEISDVISILLSNV